MASYVTPLKNTAFIMYVSLPSQANPNIFQSTPTLASGDFKVSIDGGTLNNLTTLPTVTPAAGKMVKISLSSTEMNGDNITVVCSDAAGAEWRDITINIQTSVRQIDDLATTSALATVQADTDDIQTRLPAALVSGRIDASVGAMATGVVTATAIAADAITDAKVAADVTIASVTGAVGSVTGAVGSVTGAVGSVTGAVGSVTGNVGGNVVGSVASVTAGVTVTTNNDKTGYGLSAAAVQAIWNALTSALTTVGSVGKLLVDNVNATVSSRSTQTSVDTVASYIDTEVAAIKAKTDNLPTDPADASDVAAAIAALNNISVANILAGVVEGSYTVKDALRLGLSVLTGKSSGGGTTTVIFRDTGDTKNRVTATVDSSGDRTAVTLDPS